MHRVLSCRSARRVAALVLLSGGSAADMSAHAADWIMLQGTEPADVSHRVFGTASLSYIDNFGCNALAGLRAPNGTATGGTTGGPTRNNGSFHNACVNAPEFKDTASFIADNLAVGVRGNLLPGRINYFVALNAGENPLTYNPFETRRHTLVGLQDASVTLSVIPGVRLRAGLFKKPGPEEIQRAAPPDFIFPSQALGLYQQEVFVRGNAYTRTGLPIAGQGFAGNVSPHGYDSDLGRDWGIQAFDAFKFDRLSLTYALMLANGNGIHLRDDLNPRGDVNAMLAAEYDLPGGKGPGKHGVKAYGYWQQGKRRFETDAAGTRSQEFDRIRYGFGARALGNLFGEGNGKHRIGLDATLGEGMIFYAPAGNVVEGNFFNGVLGVAAERGNKARGVTLDYGYYLGEKWQFDARWGWNEHLYATAGVWKPEDLRRVEDWTFGITYSFTPALRLSANYQIRDFKAPNAVPPTAATAAAINNAAVQTRNQNIVTGSVGDRIGARLSYTF